jgi:hypothetical protein
MYTDQTVGAGLPAKASLNATNLPQMYTNQIVGAGLPAMAALQPTY